MLILGFLLVLVGLLAILVALFGTGGTNDTAEFLGNDLTTLTVFFIGLAAGVAVLWGFSIIRFGIKRSMQRRRERKQLTELSEKLERVEGERRDDDTDTSKL
jgi:hypothetical protein